MNHPYAHVYPHTTTGAPLTNAEAQVVADMQSLYRQWQAAVLAARAAPESGTLAQTAERLRIAYETNVDVPNQLIHAVAALASARRGQDDLTLTAAAKRSLLDRIPELQQNVETLRATLARGEAHAAELRAARLKREAAAKERAKERDILLGDVVEKERQARLAEQRADGTAPPSTGRNLLMLALLLSPAAVGVLFARMR